MRKRTLLSSKRARKESSTLSHIDAQGRARMVDVGDKPVTQREARARAVVRMQPDTLRCILEGRVPKGEVLSVARIAGIMAAKRTAELVPLCHPLPLEVAEVEIEPLGPDQLEIRSCVRVSAKTGVEMEALVAVSVAALTVYDMCKAVDREMEIGPIYLVEKSGGRSGVFRRKASHA
jgi:cyclic pyranopterin phosphate synthase